MLFTDELFVTAADLKAIESEADTIATNEQITLSTLISRVIAECGSKLLAAFEGAVVASSADLSANHIAAVMHTGTDTVSTKIRLGQVVVSSPDGLPSPISQWVTYRALEALFRDAFARSPKSSTYEAKHEIYRGLAMQHYQTMRDLGIPVVLIPFPAPGAVHELDSGTWDASALSAVAGGSNPETAYNVAITWVDDTVYTASDPKQGESGRSAILTFTVPANQLLRVDISALNPPAGTVNQGVAYGLWNTRKATGWNIYAGTGVTLYRQNATPVAIATKQYTLAAAPVLSGWTLRRGQIAEYRLACFRQVMRA